MGPNLYVHVALLALALLSTSCGTSRPVKVCASRMEPLPIAWEAPDDNALWPQPKKLEVLEGEPWDPTTSLSIYCSDKKWRSRLGRAFPKLNFSDDPEAANVQISSDGSLSSLPAGAYRLTLENNSVKLDAHDVEGASYGLQTLRQLFELGRYEPVKIEDWPTCPVRGLMLHTGSNSGPTHRRLITDAMGPLKMNLLLLECEYAQWESHPELWDKRLSVSLPELKKTVEKARDTLVEPVPLIQTLSHMDWIFANGQNTELGESSNGYSFPPDNKEAWDTVLDVYQEAVDLFRPRWFHIGFDEVRGLKGLFPGSDQHTEIIIAKHAEILRLWLAEKGIQTVMWADTLIHHSEAGAIGLARSPETARYLRETINKETILIDWQYELKPPVFPEMKLLADAGFPLMVGTWNDPITTLGHTRSLVEEGGLGVIHTTWPGRVLNDRVVEGSEFYQFAEMVTAAEAAWNGGANSIENSAPTFRRLWSHHVPPPSCAGKSVVYEGQMSENLKDSTDNLGGVYFHTGRELKIDQATEIALDAVCEEIEFLLYAKGVRKPGVAVAKLLVEFEDGTHKETPLRWLKEVERLKAGVLMYRAPVAWQEGPRRIYRWGWVNPEPEKRIKKLRLTPSLAGSELVIEGITLLDQAVSDY